MNVLFEFVDVIIMMCTNNVLIVIGVSREKCWEGQRGGRQLLD